MLGLLLFNPKRYIKSPDLNFEKKIIGNSIFWLGTQLGSSGSDLGFHTRPIKSFCFVVAIFDQVHDVEFIFGLCS